MFLKGCHAICFTADMGHILQHWNLMCWSAWYYKAAPPSLHSWWVCFAWRVMILANGLTNDVFWMNDQKRYVVWSVFIKRKKRKQKKMKPSCLWTVVMAVIKLIYPGNYYTHRLLKQQECFKTFHFFKLESIAVGGGAF